ncbi:tetratricopeptide repeat protein [Pelotomaculum propionicicum]|uniref:tetratricopeptide repeat protein n=1 Tax=Pelotomaculum propionicicum TaxID=258475 RepID=UPI003B829182
MFFGRSRNKLRRAIFITITALIAIGLVIPLASLFQDQPSGGGAQNSGTAQKTPQERLAELEAEAVKSPGNTAVLMELAEAYIYTSKPDQAVKTYEQVLAADPGYSEARYMIAYVYYMSGKFDQAETNLKELAQKDPNFRDTHLLYGYVLGAGKKDYAGGIQELEKFIALAREGSDVEKAKLTINEWKTAQAKN